MAKKKNKPVPVSQEDNIQAQQVLEHYHQVAQNLRLGTDQKQAESALTEINNMSEGAQVALLKALSKEHQTDAADVLLAINELSPLKDVRKEARRSLIRLEGVRVYPEWRPPLQPTLAMQVTNAPLRFWKGVVTDTFASGEVELILLFEQEDDPGEIRVLRPNIGARHELGRRRRHVPAGASSIARPFPKCRNIDPRQTLGRRSLWTRAILRSPDSLHSQGCSGKVAGRSRSSSVRVRLRDSAAERL